MLREDLLPEKQAQTIWDELNQKNHDTLKQLWNELMQAHTKEMEDLKSKLQAETEWRIIVRKNELEKIK